MRAPIPDFPGYEVTCDGHVWSSVERGSKPPRKLRPKIDGVGRHNVVLYRNKKGHHKRVHQLVLLAFVGPRPDGLFACHNNGNPADNRIENLRYDTPKANQLDRKKHSNGIWKGNQKLTPKQVHQIRKFLNRGWTHKRIAKRYNVVRSTISWIAGGKHWPIHTGKN